MDYGKAPHCSPGSVNKWRRSLSTSAPVLHSHQGGRGHSIGRGWRSTPAITTDKLSLETMSLSTLSWAVRSLTIRTNFRLNLVGGIGATERAFRLTIFLTFCLCPHCAHSPNGSRTRIPTLRGLYPKPLDDKAEFC